MDVDVVPMHLRSPRVEQPDDWWAVMGGRAVVIGVSGGSPFGPPPLGAGA
jgi:hypothetical protein